MLRAGTYGYEGYSPEYYSNKWKVSLGCSNRTCLLLDGISRVSHGAMALLFKSIST